MRMIRQMRNKERVKIKRVLELNNQELFFSIVLLGLFVT